jgi:hypothetical protein
MVGLSKNKRVPPLLRSVQSSQNERPQDSPDDDIFEFRGTPPKKKLSAKRLNGQSTAALNIGGAEGLVVNGNDLAPVLLNSPSINSSGSAVATRSPANRHAATIQAAVDLPGDNLSMRREERDANRLRDGPNIFEFHGMPPKKTNIRRKRAFKEVEENAGEDNTRRDEDTGLAASNDRLVESNALVPPNSVRTSPGGSASNVPAASTVTRQAANRQAAVHSPGDNSPSGNSSVNAKRQAVHLLGNNFPIPKKRREGRQNVTKVGDNQDENRTN